MKINLDSREDRIILGLTAIYTVAILTVFVILTLAAHGRL